MNLDRPSLMLRWLLLIISVFSWTVFGQAPEKPKRNLLFIGQAKGYQHEAISTAMPSSSPGTKAD